MSMTIAEVRQRINTLLDTLGDAECDGDTLLDLKWQLHKAMGRLNYSDLSTMQVVVALSVFDVSAVAGWSDVPGKRSVAKHLRIVG